MAWTGWIGRVELYIVGNAFVRGVRGKEGFDKRFYYYKKAERLTSGESRVKV